MLNLKRFVYTQRRRMRNLMLWLRFVWTFSLREWGYLAEAAALHCGSVWPHRYDPRNILLSQQVFWTLWEWDCIAMEDCFRTHPQFLLTIERKRVLDWMETEGFGPNHLFTGRK